MINGNNKKRKLEKLIFIDFDNYRIDAFGKKSLKFEENYKYLVHVYHVNVIGKSLTFERKND